MRKVLVTGATCYVGRALVGRLMADGVEVHAVTRPTTDPSRLDVLPARPVLHVHDGTTERLAEIVRTVAPEVVFHLAGLYVRRHAGTDVTRMLDSNVVFGSMLLEALHRSGGGRLVNTGTYFQFMDGGGYRPLNLYAATKEAFESVLAYYVDAGLLQATTLVIFDTYGSDDWRPRLMAAIRDARATGTPLPLPMDDPPLDMVHVDDVVAAFVRAGELLLAQPATVNGWRYAVSLGRRHTIEEIVSVFETVGGQAIPRRRGAYPAAERTVTYPWVGPLLPGWSAQVSLEDGVRRILEGR